MSALVPLTPFDGIAYTLNNYSVEVVCLSEYSYICVQILCNYEVIPRKQHIDQESRNQGDWLLQGLWTFIVRLLKSRPKGGH